MEAKTIFNQMRQIDSRYTRDDAQFFKELCDGMGLTPFYDCYPVLTHYNGKHGMVHSVSVKTHYATQQRWAEKSGGYSTPVREVRDDARGKTKTVPGVYARIGVLTNADFGKLVWLAQNVPGFDFLQEREAFIKYGEAFVPDSHPAPAGKSVAWVAEKRAREEALKIAFGTEPPKASEQYIPALSAEGRREAAAALYGEPALAPALTAEEGPPVVDGEFTPPEVVSEGNVTTAKGTPLNELTPEQLGVLIAAIEKAPRLSAEERERLVVARALLEAHHEEAE